MHVTQVRPTSPTYCRALRSGPLSLATALMFSMVLIALAAAFSQASADDTKPLLRLDTGGHISTIRSVIFHPDGKHLVSAGDDKVIRIWNIDEGRTVRTIRGQIDQRFEGLIFTMALSPDGRTLAVAGFMAPGFGVRNDEVGWIRLHDFETGALTGLLKGHKNAVSTLAFSPDGSKLASAGADKTPIIWDVDARKPLHRLKGHEREVYGIAFTPDGKRVATAGFDETLRLWRVADGTELAQMRGHSGRVRALVISPTSGEIISSGHDYTIKRWNGETGALIGDLTRTDTYVPSLAISPDGRYLLTGVFKPKPSDDPYRNLVFDLSTGKQILAYEGHDHTVLATGISPDGRWAATGGGNRKEIHIWRLATGELRQTLKGVGAAVWSAGISKDGSRIAWGNERAFNSPNDRGPLGFQLKLPSGQRALATPRALPKDGAQSFERARDETGSLSLNRRKGGQFGHYGILDVERDGLTTASLMRGGSDGYSHAAYTFTPDAKAVVSGGLYGMLFMYDLNGKKTGSFDGHASAILAVAVSGDGRFLVSGSQDQTLRLWNVKTRELIATMFHASNGEWVIWTPQGYYSSSPGGDRYVGWHVNRGADKAADYVRAAQLKQHFFRPDIVDRAIRLASAKQAVEEAQDTDFALDDLITRKIPEFTIVSPKSGAETRNPTVEITLQLSANEDPIEDIEVTVNGRKTDDQKTRGARPLETGAHTRTLKVPVSRGENKIRIAVHNAVGKTVRELVLRHRGTGLLDERGTLFIVAIGVDDYPKIDWDLNYAGRDASAFHDALVRHAGPLHQRVESRLLINGGETEPTRDNIEDALDLFRDAGPEDTVVLFIAGHGVNQRDSYYFLPTDAEERNGRFRSSTVVKWGNLESALRESKGRRIMLVDTCHAGNAYNARLIKDAADANIIVFSATDAETEAQEMSRLGHGVFTYALLQGLNGAADLIRDNNVNMLELGTYVATEVRRLTEGRQLPSFHFSGATDFVIGRM